jgi:hypothetical protein
VTTNSDVFHGTERELETLTVRNQSCPSLRTTACQKDLSKLRVGEENESVRRSLTVQKGDIRICLPCALRPEDSVGRGCVDSQFPGRSGSDPCEQRGQLQYYGQVHRPIAVGNR